MSTHHMLFTQQIDDELFLSDPHIYAPCVN